MWICSKLTIETAGRRPWRRFEHPFSGISIVGFKQVNVNWKFTFKRQLLYSSPKSFEYLQTLNFAVIFRDIFWAKSAKPCHRYLMGPNSSVIRRNGESQSGCFKKTKHVKLPEKRTFLTPRSQTYVCVSGGKKRSFFGNLKCFVFLKHPFWDWPYYRRLTISFSWIFRWSLILEFSSRWIERSFYVKIFPHKVLTKFQPTKKIMLENRYNKYQTNFFWSKSLQS